MTEASRRRPWHRLTSAILVPAFLLGCASAVASSRPTSGGPTADAAALATCDQAFGAWINLAEGLNAPGADLAQLLFQQEQIERRVFELCTLAQAEALNRNQPVEIAPGVTKPLIEPDFRTFADVECVDESPLLDGTPLCVEVGH